MRVLFISSEVYPFSKTGGLADVSGALPKALAALGHEVLVVSPWYKQLHQVKPLWIGDVDVPFEGGFVSVGVGRWRQPDSGVEDAFVGHPFFQRERYYGYDDDMRRFALFSRSIAQVCARCNFYPDIVHCNDWQSGYVPLIFKHGWHLPKGFSGLPCLFTIHNARFLGESAPQDIVHQLRLSAEFADGWMNFYGTALAMRAALGYADAINAVSPSYAEEITTPEYGYHLAGSYYEVRHKLSGIVNGIDTEVWSPSNIAALPQGYTADDTSGKALAKLELCRRYGLDAERPLLVTVSRLAEQKGIDIVLHALPYLLEQGWNVFMLGSGEAELEAWIRYTSSQHQGRFASYVGYEETFSHLVYAAADAIAIASRFEPCGLTQMISMHCGTIPIARATGGLRDTIRHGETGFLFEDANPTGLLWATEAARRTYDTPYWQKMMHNGMQEDFSWQRSARSYEALYQRLMAKNPRT